MSLKITQFSTFFPLSCLSGYLAYANIHASNLTQTTITTVVSFCLKGFKDPSARLSASKLICLINVMLICGASYLLWLKSAPLVLLFRSLTFFVCFLLKVWRCIFGLKNCNLIFSRIFPALLISATGRILSLVFTYIISNSSIYFYGMFSEFLLIEN